MKKANQIFLFISTICWGCLIGGIIYSHIAFMPSFLTHLPDSSIMVNGPYPVNDEIFWKTIHPITMLSTLIALALNWKFKFHRNYILIATVIYVLALIATFTYFVPELIEFSKSNQSSVSADEWLARGDKWQHLSWIRGTFMTLGYVMLLIALSKTDSKEQQ